MPTWRLGTIGFGYPDWRDVFYPGGIKPADYLNFYSKHFDAVELDTTFHAVPTPERISKWAAAVPGDFRFCVKTPKEVTHAPAPLSRRTSRMLDFLRVARLLGDKLGVVLLQFLPSFDTGEARDLKKFLKALPVDVRFALELRHASWTTGQTGALLREHGCAWVIADYLEEPWEIPATADFLYVRWIGVHGRFAKLDREQVDVTERLQWWKQRLAKLDGVETVWGFMNNDYSGYAVETCNRVKRLVGMPVTDLENPRQGQLFM